VPEEHQEAVAGWRQIILGIAKTFAIERLVAPGIGLKEGILDELRDDRLPPNAVS